MYICRYHILLIVYLSIFNYKIVLYVFLVITYVIQLHWRSAVSASMILLIENRVSQLLGKNYASELHLQPTASFWLLTASLHSKSEYFGQSWHFFIIFCLQSSTLVSFQFSIPSRHPLTIIHVSSCSVASLSSWRFYFVDLCST